jgi:hypothetical protein
MLCFFILSNLEPQFFLLHFYQAIFYLIIILMLFYMEDRWAYAMGILAPSVWLILAFSTGLLGACGEPVPSGRAGFQGEPGRGRAGCALRCDDHCLRAPLAPGIFRVQAGVGNVRAGRGHCGRLLRRDDHVVLEHGAANGSRHSIAPEVPHR